jgi:hypothetical protein
MTYFRISIIALALYLSGCGKDSDNSSSNSQQVSLPEGWEQIDIDANRGTTKIYSHGHFHVSWNPCFQEAWGAIKNPQAWDSIVRNTNIAVKSPLLSEQRCFQADPGNRMDSKVVARLSPDMREFLLLESQGGQTVCTKISNQQAARELLQSINLVIREAELEDCYRD